MSLRVLFVIPGVSEGSSMVFARRQAAALETKGIVVGRFFLRSRTEPWQVMQEAKRLRAEIRAFDPHVVHAHFGTTTGLLTVLVSSKPVVITFRGSDLNRVPTSSGWTLSGMRAWTGRLFSRLAAVGAAGIVCVSHQLRDRLWFGAEKARVLPSGVDLDEFAPYPRSEARMRLGWGDEPVILFNAGLDARNKRLDLARAAETWLQTTMPAARLEVLCGGVPPSEMPLYMSAADCLLVTSDAEGSPTAVQEALATNLPVVSVDVGDVPERLAGVLQTRIVTRDPQALASALAEVLRDGRRSNGRAHARPVSHAHITEELIHLYREVAAEAADTTWNITHSLLRPQ
jgi:teichuronic acid biosynthesis glycosyltransferase TuaC